MKKEVYIPLKIEITEITLNDCILSSPKDYEPNISEDGKTINLNNINIDDIEQEDAWYNAL